MPGEQLPFTTENARDAAGFRSALRHFQAQSDTVARRFHLTPQRYLLLLMIKGSPDGLERSTVTELSRALHLAQTTVTDLVTRAEQSGLVSRGPAGHDGRVTHVTLTEKGEQQLRGAYEALAGERTRLRSLLAGLQPPPTRPA